MCKIRNFKSTLSIRALGPRVTKTKIENNKPILACKSKFLPTNKTDRSILQDEGNKSKDFVIY